MLIFSPYTPESIVSHSIATAAQVTVISAADREDAAGDAFNGINESLWQHIREQIGHAPSYNECIEFVQAMPADSLSIYL